MAVRVTQLLLCLSSVAAFRVQEKRIISQEKTFKVQLLVTRHGLSCANVAQKWISNYDFGRARMHDTLLSAAGVSASEESGKEVNQWLEKNGYGIDAVLSSVLARAMETAYYMFPKHSGTLHVMPYIREIGMGSSNAPKPQSEQPAHLQSALGSKAAPKLLYSWVNVFGSNVGTWEEFLMFLEQFFLPELISTKGADTTITLPVVTHSNFMKDSLGKCSHAWKDKGESKPLNNQVVNMVYTFETVAQNRSNEQIPSFFVLGSDYSDGRLNGAWVRLDQLHSGKPQYAKQTDSKCKIEWSNTRKTWRMFIDNAVGGARQSLFQSEVDSPTLPVDGWGPAEQDGMIGKLKGAFNMDKEKKEMNYGEIPRFVLYNAQYKLKEATGIPCDEIASGLSLKKSKGAPDRLCDRDVGAQCAASIRNNSFCASCLEIAEDVLKKEYAIYEKAQTSYLQNEEAFKSKAAALQEQSAATGGYEVLTVFGSKSSKVQRAGKIEEQANLVTNLQSYVDEMARHQDVIKKKHEVITEVSQQSCLMGGHPVPPS